MSDQELVIKISAKNLTAKEFADARKELTGLSKETDEASKKSEDFGKTFKGVAGTVLTAAGLITGAVIGIGAAILEMGSHGADVNDVKQQFDTLNKTIGNDSKAALTTLQTAFDHTISKFDLMSITNKALSAGLRVSLADFKTMGEGARVLSDRVGGDAKGAYEAITEALASGKTARLTSIGLNIDETQALNDHAKALGVDVTQLNEHGKKLALQDAIMRELTRTVKESGRAQLDFADSLSQAAAKFADWKDDLSSGIAESKVLGVALDAVNQIIADVFGGENQDSIKTIVGLIEDGAMMIVEWGRTAVAAGDLVARVFKGTEAVFNGVAGAVAILGSYFFKLVEGLSYAASYIPGFGDKMGIAKEQAKELSTFLGGAAEGFFKTGGAAAESAIGVRDSNSMFNKLDKTLADVGVKMSNAKGLTDSHTDATDKNSKAVKDRAAAGDELIHTLKEEAEAWDYMQKKQAEALALAAGALSAGAVGQSSDFVKKWQARSAANQQNMGLLRLDRKTTFATTAASVAMPGQFAEQEQRAMQQYLRPSITAGFGSMFSKDVPQAMLAAIQGGGNPMAAAGGLMGGKLGENVVSKFGGVITGALGKTLGGAINAILPGVGTMIGPAIEKLGGLIKKAFGGPSKEELAGRTESASFQEQIAKMLTAQQRAQAGGEKWKMTMIGVRDMYLATGRTAEEAEKITAQLFDTKHPEAYKHAMEEITGVMGEQAKDQEDLQSAIERYGFTLDELGPKMRKQQLTEQAMGLANDFRLLIGSGIDLGVVIERMGGSLNSFVQTAIKSGTEIPAEMKPIIEKMIEMGKLTDENGNKIDSLEGSGITFSETMTQGFDRVVGALNRVLVGLGLVAATDIPDKDFNITGHNITVDDGSGNSGDNSGAEVPAFASEAYVRRPTLAVVGDTPEGEMVLKPSTVKKWMGAAAEAGAGNGGGNTVVVNINTVAANAEAIRTLVYKEIGPRVIDWLNKGGSPQTDLKHILGLGVS